MLSIILLHDDYFILKSLKSTLMKNKNWHVDAFTSAKDAINRANNITYDIAIADYDALGTKKIRFLAEMKRIQPEVASLILTNAFNHNVLVESIHRVETFRTLNESINITLSKNTLKEYTSSFTFNETNSYA
jgi:DNA-binding NtrC family response regulator